MIEGNMKIKFRERKVCYYMLRHPSNLLLSLKKLEHKNSKSEKKKIYNH